MLELTDVNYVICNGDIKALIATEFSRVRIDRIALKQPIIVHARNYQRLFTCRINLAVAYISSRILSPDDYSTMSHISCQLAYYYSRIAFVMSFFARQINLETVALMQRCISSFLPGHSFLALRSKLFSARQILSRCAMFDYFFYHDTNSAT